VQVRPDQIFITQTFLAVLTIVTETLQHCSKRLQSIIMQVGSAAVVFKTHYRSGFLGQLGSDNDIANQTIGFIYSIQIEQTQSF
jgi:hypothetical protein